jgi:hypothetical protein
MQVDALRPGLLGKTRDAFAIRYCARKLIPVRSGSDAKKKYDNSGLSHAKELHDLLKQVRNLKLCCARVFDTEESCMPSCERSALQISRCM